ncbi:hypothetical protein LHFGNBLO_003234 [Mesorhizobium sp. AR10]|uniref:hypothetical protein n=1 Tax=Mesorhizobium sp. AR10 TaxID=2865839 RepID=UPI00215F89FE|nr:hypothetical protein [Mesorhizobium sp. AR10]UVK36326.1 hypothetical protein LHFGNBLO_003234 [Mesorhizobium sp. AR10]
MARVFKQAVSLGPVCRGKFHIKKVLAYGGKRGVFDGQVTPPSALIEYLRRDFVGMFERDDLYIENKRVFNRRFGTNHIHEFPEDVTEATLDLLYPEARRKHDVWCANTRKALTCGLSTLFVLSRPVAKPDLAEITDLVQGMAPRRKFLLLPSPEDDSGDDWTGNHALWRDHLSRFMIRPPLLTRAKFWIHQMRKNRHRRKARSAGA